MITFDNLITVKHYKVKKNLKKKLIQVSKKQFEQTAQKSRPSSAVNKINQSLRNDQVDKAKDLFIGFNVTKEKSNVNQEEKKQLKEKRLFKLKMKMHNKPQLPFPLINPSHNIKTPYLNTDCNIDASSNKIIFNEYFNGNFSTQAETFTNRMNTSNQITDNTLYVETFSQTPSISENNTRYYDDDILRNFKEIETIHKILRIRKSKFEKSLKSFPKSKTVNATQHQYTKESVKDRHFLDCLNISNPIIQASILNNHQSTNVKSPLLFGKINERKFKNLVENPDCGASAFKHSHNKNKTLVKNIYLGKENEEVVVKSKYRIFNTPTNTSKEGNIQFRNLGVKDVGNPFSLIQFPNNIEKLRMIKLLKHYGNMTILENMFLKSPQKKWYVK